MLTKNLPAIHVVRHIITLNLTMLLMISLAGQVMGQGGPEQLLKEGSRYQAIDDTSDRAAELYQQLIRTHPKSAQAEAAQFFLGGYYSRKFFIIENRSNVQDWGSMNRAEQELYTYLGNYQNGFYVADAYHTLALIALRRGYWENAKKLWMQMREVAAKDRKVYIFRVTWSTYSEDVIKGYCDTAGLADVSLYMLDKQLSFDQLVSGLTNWARGQCRSAN
jgi:hypothetical protein